MSRKHPRHDADDCPVCRLRESLADQQEEFGFMAEEPPTKRCGSSPTGGHVYADGDSRCLLCGAGEVQCRI